jgi:hypothetical protein
MADANGMADKNLSNEVQQLAQTPVNSLDANHLNQQKKDRRHENAINHHNPVDQQHPKS